MMENDSDYVFDDFADLNDVDWDQILPVAPNIDDSNPTNSLAEPASLESSVYDFSDVFYDSATLAQIDELERQAMNRERAPAQLGIHLVCSYPIFLPRVLTNDVLHISRCEPRSVRLLSVPEVENAQCVHNSDTSGGVVDSSSSAQTSRYFS